MSTASRHAAATLAPALLIGLALLAGPLPAAIQSATNYAVAIPVGSPNPEAARSFVQAMTTPAAKVAISKAGLTPLR